MPRVREATIRVRSCSCFFLGDKRKGHMKERNRRDGRGTRYDEVPRTDQWFFRDPMEQGY